MKSLRRRRGARPTRRELFGPAAKWTFGAVATVIVAFVGAEALPRLQRRRLVERVRHTYVAGECTVTSKEVHVTTHVGPGWNRSYEERNAHPAFEPLVRYRYRVGGRDLEGDRFSPKPPSEDDRTRIERLLRRYEVGTVYPCWHDPERPEDAFLERQ